jgi:hypothetical protein
MKGFLYSRRLLTWTAVFLISSTSPDLAHAQTFQDSTFNASDWNSVLLPNSIAGSTFTASQDNTNGNPPSSRLTTHIYPTGAIFVAHLYKQSTPYDPANQGAIATLGYSYDLSHYTALKVAYSILIYQNSTYYYHLPNDLISGSTWTPFTGANLTAASFTKLDGPSPNVNPDFSCKGSPLVFGYVTRNSNPNAGTTDTTKSGIDNWQVSIEGKTPCCAAIGGPKITCDKGVFTYTFTVTNNSSQAIQYILLSPPAGATFTISPNVINLGTNPLQTGQSTTVNVSITNASPGDHVCINVALADKSVITCCTTQACVDLPECPCLKPDPKVECGAHGSYTVTISVQNLTLVPVHEIFIVPTSPSNVNISPQLVTLSTPLPPNQTTTFTITITGAAPRSKVCLRLAPIGKESQCCSTEICFTLPVCPSNDKKEKS